MQYVLFRSVLNLGNSILWRHSEISWCFILVKNKCSSYSIHHSELMGKRYGGADFNGLNAKRMVPLRPLVCRSACAQRRRRLSHRVCGGMPVARSISLWFRICLDVVMVGDAPVQEHCFAANLALTQFISGVLFFRCMRWRGVFNISGWYRWSSGIGIFMPNWRFLLIVYHIKKWRNNDVVVF